MIKINSFTVRCSYFKLQFLTTKQVNSMCWCYCSESSEAVDVWEPRRMLACPSCKARPPSLSRRDESRRRRCGRHCSRASATSSLHRRRSLDVTESRVLLRPLTGTCHVLVLDVHDPNQAVTFTLLWSSQFNNIGVRVLTDIGVQSTSPELNFVQCS